MIRSRKDSFPSLENEIQAGYPATLVAGVDEVGRGCLAGPVVAGAVILPHEIDLQAHPWISDIHDSKKVVPALREKLAPLILAWAFAAGIGVASVEEIDRLNIFHASHLAMVRAVQSLRVQPSHLLVDGKFVPREGLTIPATAIIQGDQKSLSIAAASVIAKVWRDEYMRNLDEKFPGYGFSQHKGYPTAVHSVALKKLGVTDVHRRSFSQVKLNIQSKAQRSLPFA